MTIPAKQINVKTHKNDKARNLLRKSFFPLAAFIHSFRVVRDTKPIKSFN